ncbi:MAG: queuosine precursor transporter [Bacteroidales bacterium]|nr:queuosine precursor transporter [Bacteroidales bacterium]
MFGFADSVSEKIGRRREVVYLIFAGIFLGSLTMLNILGISRFIDLSFNLFGVHIPFTFAVGVLAYPITFLSTDFISELYGKKRANTLVWIGLMLNFWVIFIMWVGGLLPPTDHLITGTEGLGYMELPPLPKLDDYATSDWAFFRMRQLTFGAVTASMIAYLTAQFVDVHVFHFIKKLTKGNHLWIRNNFSTMTSQLVDSTAVILITHYYAKALPIDNTESLSSQLIIFILSTYVFKIVAAAIDTVPFYFGTKYLSKFLEIDTLKEFKEERYK